MSAPNPNSLAIAEPAAHRLPLELLGPILEETVLCLVDERKWKLAASLSLLSPALRPWTQRALYHSISLAEALRANFDTVPRPSQISAEEAYVTRSQNLKLLKTLEEISRLSQAVRRLLVGIDGTRFSQAITSQDTERALSYCRNVYAVLEAGEKGATSNAISAALKRLPCPHLTTVKLDYLFCLPARLGPLQSLVNLQHLELGQMGLTNELGPPPPFRLKSLVIHSANVRHDSPAPRLKRDIHYLLSNSITSIERLSYPVMIEPLDLSLYPNLTAVHPVTEGWKKDGAESILQACATVQRLLQLRIGIIGLGGYSPRYFLDSYLLINRLPISIVSLTLAYCLVESFEAYSTPLRNLRRVEIERTTFIPEARRMDAIARICDARGIAFFSNRDLIEQAPVQDEHEEMGEERLERGSTSSGAAGRTKRKGLMRRLLRK